jgi:hypothetical protein
MSCGRARDPFRSLLATFGLELSIDPDAAGGLDDLGRFHPFGARKRCELIRRRNLT